MSEDAPGWALLVDLMSSTVLCTYGALWLAQGTWACWHGRDLWAGAFAVAYGLFTILSVLTIGRWLFWKGLESPCA